jgi:hypothetical protein
MVAIGVGVIVVTTPICPPPIPCSILNT